MAKAGSMDEAHAINNQYNVNWLRTEYVHGVRSSRSAKQWDQIQTDKDIYGFLRYMPSMAANPRNAHKRLYGVIKPVDSPFWDVWFPPSDWGCMCGTEKVRSDADTREMPDDIELPPRVMRNNPGKSGEIINDAHPMIDQLSKSLQKRIGTAGENMNAKIIQSQSRGFARENLVGNKFSTRDGKQVEITSGGIEKILSQTSQQYALRDSIVPFIPGIVKSMTPTRTIKPSKENRRNIINSHIYELDWGKYKISLLVWEMMEKGRAKYVLHAMYLKK